MAALTTKDDRQEPPGTDGRRDARFWQQPLFTGLIVIARNKMLDYRRSRSVTSFTTRRVYVIAAIARFAKPCVGQSSTPLTTREEVEHNYPRTINRFKLDTVVGEAQRSHSSRDVGRPQIMCIFVQDCWHGGRKHVREEISRPWEFWPESSGDMNFQRREIHGTRCARYENAFHAGGKVVDNRAEKRNSQGIFMDRFL